MAVKDQIIRLKADVGDVKTKLAEVNKAFEEQGKKIDELSKRFESNSRTTDAAGNSIAKTLGKIAGAAVGFIASKQAIEGFFEAVKRGGEFSGVEASFERLNEKAGLLASATLPALEAATGNAVSKFDLMKEANFALIAGIKPELYTQVADSVNKLATALGKDTKDALHSVTTALVTQNSEALRSVDVILSQDQAQEAYAKRLGKTKAELTAYEKQQAFIVVGSEKLIAASGKLGETQDTVANATQRFTKAQKDAYDQFAVGTTQSEELRDSIDKIAKLLRETDWESLGRAVGGAFATAGEYVAGFTKNLALAIDDFTDSSLIAKVQRLSEIQNEVTKLQDEIASGKPRVSFFGGSTPEEDLASLGKETVKLVKEMESLGRAQTAIAKGGKPTADSLHGTGEASEAAAKAAEKAAKKLAELRLEFTQLGTKTAITGLQQQIEKAIEGVDRTSFDSIRTQIEQQFRELKTSELTEKFGTAIDQTQIAEQVSAEWTIAAGDYEDKLGEASKKAADKFADEMKKAQEEIDKRFQQSADFFSEALYNSMTGAAFDIEDLFKRVFAGIAGGFLSQITGGLGAGLNSPQGIGQLIGKVLAGGGLSAEQSKALGPLGSILGLGGGAGGPAVALTGSATALTSAAAALTGAAAALTGSAAASSFSSLAQGFQLGGSGIPAGQFDLGGAFGGVPLGGGATAGGAGLIGNFASLGLGAGLGAGAAIVITGAAAADFARSVSQGSKPSLASSAILALPTFGASLIPQIPGASDLFGFGGGLSEQQAVLGGRIDALIEQGVLGDKGTFSFFGGGQGRLRASEGGNLSKDAEQLVGLSNTFSLLTQGDIDEQFSGLFANALSEAGSFNEALLTVNGLLEKAGISAEQAGQQITQAYLDGTISIEEFNEALNVTNQLASEDLASLEDAADLLAASFGGPPRDQLKALELQFHELKDAGITEASAVVDYFTNTFAPEAGQSIQDMISAGIDVFGDFSSLTVPQIQLVLNEIQQMQSAFAEVGTDGEQAANRTARGFRSANDDVTKFRRNLQGAAGDLKNWNSSAAGSNAPGVQ